LRDEEAAANESNPFTLRLARREEVLQSWRLQLELMRFQL
jgi:hypothetical protein